MAAAITSLSKSDSMTKILIFISSILMISLGACVKENEPAGTTAIPAKAMANEWWVTLKIGTDDLLGTHVAFSTYNTAANDDSLWVDDLEIGYGFKCKVKTDMQNLSFATSGSIDEYTDVQGNDGVAVTIANGKIIPNGGISKTGLVTDSIYFEVQFADDPGDTYIVSGTARTRQQDDDY
jgi:hypothetical protein